MNKYNPKLGRRQIVKQVMRVKWTVCDHAENGRNFDKQQRRTAGVAVAYFCVASGPS